MIRGSEGRRGGGKMEAKEGGGRREEEGRDGERGERGMRVMGVGCQSGGG